MRSVLILVCVCALGVSQVPNREVPAAASDGASVAAPYQATDVAIAAAQELCPTEAAPLAVCEDGFCRVVERVGPVRSIVRARTTACNNPNCQCGPDCQCGVFRTVSYSAPTEVVYTSSTRQPVFRSGRFMQRGPARRGFGKVARLTGRVATAPIRWLRCR